MTTQNRAGLDANLEQTEQFFSEWERLHSVQAPENNLSDWNDFFAEWEKLPPTETAIKQLPEWSESDCISFNDFAKKFNKNFLKYRQSGLMANIWRVAGIGHDELKNCQVLGWMLDRFGDHGQGDAILKLLLEEIAKQEKCKLEDNKSDVEQSVAKSIRKKVKNNYWTRLESLPLDDTESRVDIEIESTDFLIFIEVKIHAGETGNQLERYKKLIENKAAGGRETMLIFLTRSGIKSKDENLHDSIVPISWRQIANILDSHVATIERTSFIHQVFHQFAEHVRQYS